MIRSSLFYITVAAAIILLFLASRVYKGGGDAMVAMVESQVMAISFQKPVLIRKIHVSPGQIVDSGDLLIEVERPDLALDMDKKLSSRNELQRKIKEAESRYAHSLSILQTEYERKRNQLLSEKEEKEYQLRLYHERNEALGQFSSMKHQPNDTLQVKDIILINNLLKSYKDEVDMKMEQLHKTLVYDTAQYRSELVIINKEIAELKIENSKLVQKAVKPGTIGNLFVELNELVPPYTKLLSVYDLNPNLIKAFISEHAVDNLHIGAKVRVESVHKNYSIEGQIIEIGSRITSYPDKINPLLQQKSYGQEIFINIPDKNNFLNGEKVYVYVIDN